MTTLPAPPSPPRIPTEPERELCWRLSGLAHRLLQATHRWDIEAADKALRDGLKAIDESLQ